MSQISWHIVLYEVFFGGGLAVLWGHSTYIMIVILYKLYILSL